MLWGVGKGEQAETKVAKAGWNRTNGLVDGKCFGAKVMDGKS